MKFTYDTEAEIPAEIKKHYKQNDAGKWELQCEGAVAASKLAEFRENNRTLKKENDDLKEKFADVDADEYKKLKDRAELFQDGKLIAADKIEAKITERTAAMKTEHDKAVAALTTKLTAAEDSIARHEIDGVLRKSGGELGLLETAEDDLILRGRAVFKLKDGKVQAYGADGKELYSPKNSEPLSVKEWVEDLAKKAPHLFKANGGAGSGGSGGGSGGGGKGTGANPWKKETFNLTSQMTITRENPALADRMKAEAGAK